MNATEPESQDRAWAAFVQEYSRLIFSAAREGALGHDDTMDRYTFILEKMQHDSCARLRAFDGAGPGKFTTWLVVVATRLAVDHQRSKYGRLSAEEGATPQAKARRRLVDLVGEELDEESVTAPGPSPDSALRESELRTLLAASLEDLEEEELLLLTLRFEDERPVNEIMVSLGMHTKFHVYRKLNATLAKLRRALKRRGVEDPVP